MTILYFLLIGMCLAVMISIQQPLVWFICGVVMGSLTARIYVTILERYKNKDALF